MRRHAHLQQGGDGGVDGRCSDRGGGWQVFAAPTSMKARASSAKPPGRPRSIDDMTVVSRAAAS